MAYAEAADLTAILIDESVERLDSVRLRPMIDAIKHKSLDRAERARSSSVLKSEARDRRQTSSYPEKTRSVLPAYTGPAR